MDSQAVTAITVSSDLYELWRDSSTLPNTGLLTIASGGGYLQWWQWSGGQ